MSGHVVNGSPQRSSESDQPQITPPSGEPSANELFDLYERILESRPGTGDAEIFEKIREWTFSDFALAAHEFAGITRETLETWQKRHRINLSAGHIRPDPLDLERGHAWGLIRRTFAANRMHSHDGPPSADEIRLAWSKRD